MRLDNYLAETGKFSSRTKAKEAIERGEVLVNGKAAKPSLEVDGTENISFTEGAGKYVSLGAFKLERAFEVFDFSVKDKIVADVGASTGGFTQILLFHGAKKVYAVDVGESLLHPSLQADGRVVPIENFNARYLSAGALGEYMDAVVSDVSFISLTYILGGISSCLKSGGEAVVLIKPQFECGRQFLSKSGIVTDKNARLNACLNVFNYAKSLSLNASGFAPAPIKEGKNVEFLLHLVKEGASSVTEEHLRDICIKS
ncbi:MAG: TlyA family RNA methyltransferase [Clostridia bacterium]|nr:TlyA family RNA methyltransferase [Clostridia bacterium]